MLPKVYIIILNWNGLNDTIDCLESLRQIDYENYEIIVVDNNSFGDDIKILKEKYINYVSQFLINNENLGFAGGNNVGIKCALDSGADVVLILNNDTTVEPNFLSKLVESSNLNSEVGVLTPMINFYSNKSTVWFAGGYISKIRTSGIPLGINKSENLFQKSKYCTFASGCCMYVKKEVFDKIGFFDENYFLFLEDTDFSWRVSNSGFKILYEPSSKIYHRVSSTISRTSSMLNIYFNLRNRLFFARKNLDIKYYFFIITLLMLSLMTKIIFVKNRVRMIKTVFYAIKDFQKKNMGMGSFDKIVSIM